jgi:hypothetical protein
LYTGNITDGLLLLHEKDAVLGELNVEKPALAYF